MLEAIREVDPSIRFYQASSSEIFGEPRETPQTEETAPSPLTPYGVAKAYAHFIAASYRQALRDVHVLRDPLQPRVAAPAGGLPAAQGRAGGGGDLARPRGRARARRPLGPARLGLRGRLRARDVADAPARRAGGLHRRDGRLAQRSRSSSRCAFDAVSLDWREHVRIGPVALPRRRRAPRPRRRRLEGPARARLGAGGRASRSLCASWSRRTSRGFRLRPPARRRGRGRAPSRPT